MREEAQRRKVIESLRIAGTRGDSDFRNLAEMAAISCDMPVGAITVVDDNQRWFFAAFGTEVFATPRLGSLCARVIESDAPLVIEDLEDDDEAHLDNLVAADGEFRSYAAVPIIYRAGVRLGSLMVMDREIRDISESHVIFLQRLAQAAVHAFRFQETMLSQQEYVLDLHSKNAEIERKRAELERIQTDINAAAEIAELGFWSFDMKNGKGDISPSLQSILELDRKQLKGDLRPLLGGDDPEQFQDMIQRAVEGRGAGTEINLTYSTKSGEGKWLRAIARAEASSGGSMRVRGCMLDVTETVRNRNHISRLVTLDALTGIQNRRFLPLAFAKQKRELDFSSEKIVFMLVDLDHFKAVNDTRGHDVGDEVLVKVCSILKSVLREGDVLGRLGGDEFLLVVKGDRDSDVGATVSARLANEVSKTPMLQQFATPISLSIGYTEVTEPSMDFADAIKQADLAVYEAKRRGRACAKPYTTALSEQVTDRDQLLKQVDAALRRCEFVPAYQSKICMRTGRIIGFEALARWSHPARGLLSPGSFWEALETPQYATRISYEILRQVVEDLQRLKQQGVEMGRVSVNITESQLIDDSFTEQVVAQLAAAGLTPEALEMEVTEKVLLNQRSDAIQRNLKLLSSNNFSIAFDDFGTGYASLTHLRDFEIDQIKIDQSFVQNLGSDAATQAITSSVITMARKLDLRVVAEGIETVEVAALLEDMGCDYGQGYLYSRPILVEDIPAYVSKIDQAQQSGPLLVSA